MNGDGCKQGRESQQTTVIRGQDMLSTFTRLHPITVDCYSEIMTLVVDDDDDIII